jgi:hypothetical protein
VTTPVFYRDGNVGCVDVRVPPKLCFHVPFDIDVGPHVQPHAHGSEGWSVHSRHTAALSMQRRTAELTAVKFPNFFGEPKPASAGSVCCKLTKNDGGQCDIELGMVVERKCETSCDLLGHWRRITHSGREEGTMKPEIDIQRGGKDQLRRAAPTGARYAAALVAAMLASSLPLPVLSQGVELLVVDVAEGYRASKLIGSNDVNDQNEKIGTVEDTIIGRDRVPFAVLQVGGHMVAVPYQSLVLDETGSKLPGATQEALKKLPEFKYTG